MKSVVMRNEKSITIIINSLLNEEYRKDRLCSLLTNVMKLNFNVDLRTRGKFAITRDVLDEHRITTSEPRLKIRVGDEFNEWRLNTYVQVYNSKSDYILFLHEDHQFVAPPNLIQKAILEAAINDVDVWQPSFFHEYEKNRRILYEIGTDDSTDVSIYSDIDAKHWRAYGNDEKNYIISLVGLYKKNLALKFLKANRPLVRNFHPASPFDFEQNQSQTWFFPIKYGLPKKELMACIDDDLNVVGSSLIARGLHPFDHLRTSKQEEGFQHDSLYVEALRKFLRRLDQSNHRFILFRPLYSFVAFFRRITKSRRQFVFTFLGIISSKKRSSQFKKIAQNLK